MKAAVFYGGHDIRVETLPDPEPGAGEVLVRVASAGICGSDLHGYRVTPRPGIEQQLKPFENGHELAGEVVAIGPGVTALAVGQRVGIEPEHLVGCGVCEYCRRGDQQICPARGFGHRSHGFSQLDVCRATHVHALPDAVSLDSAAILDCYACAIHAIHRVPVPPFACAVILGTGAIGMTLGQVLRATGVRKVIMVGRRMEPLQRAIAAGAADVVVSQTEPDATGRVIEEAGSDGADAVFETIGGTAPTMQQGITMARRGGTVCIIGLYTADQQIDARAGLRKELTITWANSYGLWHGRSEYDIALEMLASQKLRAETIITHRFALDQIGVAFAAAEDKANSGATKVLVLPNS